MPSTTIAVLAFLLGVIAGLRLVAVLLPGDTVLAGSLRGGWWRVALEGRVLGYVYGGTLVGG